MAGTTTAGTLTRATPTTLAGVDINSSEKPMNTLETPARAKNWSVGNGDVDNKCSVTVTSASSPGASLSFFACVVDTTTEIVKKFPKVNLTPRYQIGRYVTSRVETPRRVNRVHRRGQRPHRIGILA
ncbi:hypothetical protein KC336_g84 [Hortaea werneckii]|nr:hypothetical protein KC336_g84 [Hortaea werneckii]